MRKHILARLRSLLGRVITKTPMNETVSETSERDTWLFGSETGLGGSRDNLAREMNDVASSLSDLRETLARVHGDTPFERENRADSQYAVVHHDDMLFDGEVEAPFVPAQEETSGGAGVFLFDDAPTFQDDVQEHHQHAA